MTSYLSRKLTNMSAISILLVIYIHMFYTEGADMTTLLVIENTFSGGICQIAVPLFYMISGYLFFLKMPDGIKSIKGKLKKRVKTLLIPYLLTNIMAFFFWLILSIIASRFDAIGRVVNFDVTEVINEGLLPTLRLVFIDPPIAFQLWFVRDLMGVMLLSPLLYLIIVAIRKYGTIAFASSMAVLLILYILSDNLQIAVAFFWFSIGGVLSTKPGAVEKVWRNQLLAFGLSVAFIAYAMTYGLGLVNTYTASFIPFVGIPALWCAYDLIVPNNNHSRGQIITSYTFFVYLIHEPLLNIFKKLPLLISSSELNIILSYFLVPIIFYLFACYFGKLVKRHLPKFYSLYTGNR